MDFNNNFNSIYKNQQKFPDFQNNPEFNSNQNLNIVKDDKKNANNQVNNNNINENVLFSETKEKFYNTANTFFNKDYFILNDKINENLSRENNTFNINSFSLSNSSILDKNKQSKSEIDIKYNYYLSNLNKEINKERNICDDNFIKENEQIQKLLEEEKNIEDENLKRLSELRVKYLSSIKTFDVPKEKNFNFFNNNQKNDNLNRNNNLGMKAKTERNFVSHTINEFYNNNLNMNSPPFSMSGKLSRQNNSVTNILNSPNDLEQNNNNVKAFQRDKILSQNNYSNYISNIVPQRQTNNDINNKNNAEIDNNMNKNKIINQIGSISNLSIKEENEKKDENNYNNSKNEINKENINFQNNANTVKERILNDNLNKQNLNEINSNTMDNRNILKDSKINMSIYERGKEKNKSQLYNTEQNSKINNDFYLKNDDSNGHKMLGKNNSSSYVKSQKYYNILKNNGMNNINENIEDYDLFKQNNFEDANLNANEIQKETLNKDIKEKEFIKNYNQKLNIDKQDNNNKEKINELMKNYKNLEYNYNQLQFEYNSLKNEYMKLLNNNEKETNERKIKDEKDLFNEYILKENNDLREINSNYEYIITPLINYINDINYFINKKYLKKIDIVKIKQNIRNPTTKNNNNTFEEHPLYPFIQLLQNYKNIIMNIEITNTLNNRNKSNPKLNTYESIMKHYNLKNNISFKSKNNSKEKYSKSITVTPIQSKLGKNHKIFGNQNKIAKTEKYNNNKSRGKIQEKRKHIIGKLLKNDSFSNKKYKK